MKMYQGIDQDTWHCIVPYGYNNDWPKVREMRDWCREQFARHEWTREDLHIESNFVFFREQDAVLFALKWA